MPVLHGNDSPLSSLASATRMELFMLHLRQAVIFLIFGAIATQSGAQIPPSATEESVPWSTAVDGMRIRIRADADSYGVMEPITLRVEIHNVGGTARGVARADVLKDYIVEVTGPDGQKTPLTLWGRNQEKQHRGGSAIMTVLEPGQSSSDSAVINRKFDMTLAGTYRIRVRASIPDSDGSGKWVDLASNGLDVGVSLVPHPGTN
jgi:hypothetical protein